MNDDREFRDPALDALLREHSRETPPAAVDASVRAEARGALDGESRARGAVRHRQAWRWWAPVAAAAAFAGVMVGVVPTAPTSVTPATPIASDSPADTAAVTSQPLPQTEKRDLSLDEVRPAERADAEPSHNRADGRRASAVPRAPSQSAHAAAPARQDGNAPAAAGGQEAEASSARAVGAAPALTRTAWIARIRALRAEGREPAAIRALEQFRHAFGDVDAQLPADLREWAKKLRR